MSYCPSAADEVVQQGRQQERTQTLMNYHPSAADEVAQQGRQQERTQILMNYHPSAAYPLKEPDCGKESQYLSLRSFVQTTGLGRKET